MYRGIAPSFHRCKYQNQNGNLKATSIANKPIPSLLAEYINLDLDKHIRKGHQLILMQIV